MNIDEYVNEATPLQSQKGDKKVKPETQRIGFGKKDCNRKFKTKKYTCSMQMLQNQRSNLKTKSRFNAGLNMALFWLHIKAAEG